MHLYLNFAREHWMVEGENPPVGLILCSEKESAVAHYALDGLPNKVLAAEYRTVLPKEPLLVAEIEKTIHAIETRRAAKLPGNTFSHASLLRPVNGGVDGRLGTARLQTDAIFFSSTSISGTSTPCEPQPDSSSRRPPSRSPSCGAGEEALEVGAHYFR